MILIITLSMILIIILDILIYKETTLDLLIMGIAGITGAGLVIFMSYRGNIPKKVGFSKEGTFFRYLGRDQTIHWHDIHSIITDTQYPQYPKLRMMNGEVISLGFIDKRIIHEMIKRREEFFQVIVISGKRNID
jgi:hypothetical protein